VEFFIAVATTRNVCCALRPVIPDASFLKHEWPKVADSCRSYSSKQTQLVDVLKSGHSRPAQVRTFNHWINSSARSASDCGIEMRTSVIVNFEPCCQDPPSFTFASDLMELTFAFDSNPQSTTFSTYLNGALVDSISFDTVMLSDAPAQGGAGAPR